MLLEKTPHQSSQKRFHQATHQTLMQYLPTIHHQGFDIADQRALQPYRAIYSTNILAIYYSRQL
jgi:hypothetical protein